MSNTTEDAMPVEVALAHSYRWQLLSCLFFHGDQMYLPDIATQLTIWARQDTEDHDEEHQRLIIYNALYHDHLPPLREAGLVTYDQQNDEVELGPMAPETEAAVREQFLDEFNALLTAEEASVTASGTDQ